MPTPGYVFRDGQPIPDAELQQQTQQHEQHEQEREDLTPVTRQTSTTTSSSPVITPTSSKSAATRDAPTDSHALAQADHEDKGAVQQEHFENEVKNLGWNEHPNDVPKPLVGGLYNDDLWLLVRRFNKVNAKHSLAIAKLNLSANVSCKGHRRYAYGWLRS